MDPLGQHFWTGPTDTTHTNIDKILKVGSVRKIWRQNLQSNCKAWCQMLSSRGFMPMVTFLDRDAYATITPANFAAQANAYADALEGEISVIEVGNEPHGPGKEFESFRPDGTGLYFDRLRQAIPIFNAKGIGVVAAGCPTGVFEQFRQGLNNTAPGGGGGFTKIWERLVGIGIHPYYSTPGNSLTTAGQLKWMKDQRDALDGYGATNIELYATEFGWVTKDCQGTDINLLVNEATQDAYLGQAFQNFIDHAPVLKLRVAHWFAWTDMDTANKRDGFFFAGIRTDGTRWSHAGTAACAPLATAQPWRYKNGGGQTGTTGIKATLDGFAGPGGHGVWDQTEPPPVVTTVDPPLNITQTTATLRGTVNPKGTATTYVFDYGPTVAYGFSTTPVSAGGGSAQVPVQRPISLLSDGSLYHYRIRATNALGDTVTGADKSFTTLAASGGDEPDVITGTATGVEMIKATLAGQIDPHNLPTDWHFEYGTDPTLDTHTNTTIRTLDS